MLTYKHICVGLLFLGLNTGLNAQAMKVSVQAHGYGGAENENSLTENQMILVEGGTFEMGSEDVGAFEDEGPVHQVKLDNYLIAQYEVTFAEYDMFCAYTNRKQPDDQGWGRGKRPVINVSWYDAIEFCNWRSTYEGLMPCYTINEDKTVTCNWAANGYRLPTEAEWEYAARGGKKSREFLFAGSDNAHHVAWYWDNSTKKTQPVGEKRANELGIYDMTGNVWEWVWNADHKYKEVKEPLYNPTQPEQGNTRILRGGSWLNRAYGLRTTFRRDDNPNYRFGDYGFRVVRKAP